MIDSFHSDLMKYRKKLLSVMLISQLQALAKKDSRNRHELIDIIINNWPHEHVKYFVDEWLDGVKYNTQSEYVRTNIKRLQSGKILY